MGVCSGMCVCECVCVWGGVRVGMCGGGGDWVCTVVWVGGGWGGWVGMYV